MTQGPEQNTPNEGSLPVGRRGTSMMPFDINDYLPAKPHRSLWARFGRRSAGARSDLELMVLPGTTTLTGILGTIPRLVLVMVVLLMLAFGIIRFGISTLTSQAAYPGVNQCYRIEIWLHEVSVDVTRIQWALEDAEEQVTNEAEAEEANDRIWQMFADMRTSIADKPVPLQLTELRTMWLEYIDLGLDARELNKQGKTKERAQLLQKQEDVLVQRLEEEERVRRNCRLSGTGSSRQAAGQLHPFTQIQAIQRSDEFAEGY